MTFHVSCHTSSHEGKNIGYLYAIRHGARFIWDFDDDNRLNKHVVNNTDAGTDVDAKADSNGSANVTASASITTATGRSDDRVVSPPVETLQHVRWLHVHPKLVLNPYPRMGASVAAKANPQTHHGEASGAIGYEGGKQTAGLLPRRALVDLWPRGFPLEQLSNTVLANGAVEHKLSSLSLERVAVLQSMVSGIISSDMTKLYHLISRCTALHGAAPPPA